MKKIFTLLAVLIGLGAQAQTILVQTDFTGYNGLPNTVPFGWFISNNDTSATGKTFYTGASTCGVTCPAYKFNLTGAESYIITPQFSNADSVHFYMKGNGTYKPNKFRVYGGADTTTWTLIQQFDSVSATSRTVSLPVGPAYNYLKFGYLKDSTGYNVGFDDVIIFQGSLSSVPVTENFSANLYPNPTNGLLTIDLGSLHTKSLNVTVINVIGKEVKVLTLNTYSSEYTIDLGDLEAGVYMVRVRSEYGETTRRVVLRK